MIMIWECLKRHEYLSVNQTSNIVCYLEDKKYLVNLEKDKTPLLSGTLYQYDEIWKSKDEQNIEVALDPVRHNNSTRKRNKLGR